MNSLGRYQCQMALPGFGEGGQQRLQKARVLIVGAGGLGSPVAQYLAAAGIGMLALADEDVISERNLHRQVLYNPGEIGLKKVEVATKKLQKQNPSIKIVPHDMRVTPENVQQLIAPYEIIVDGTDNFETRYVLNDACVLSGKPLVYGAIYRYEGQVAVWNVLQEDGLFSPHYRDVFPDAEKAEVPNCSGGGVLPVLTGVIGCMQANEVLKYFIDRKNMMRGKLWMINLNTGATQTIDLGPVSHYKITELPCHVSTLSYEDIRKDLSQKNYELLDVRSREEHDAFHMGGKNIPLSELEHHLDDFDFLKPIVCYCQTGIRSKIATRLIKNRFPEAKAYSLKGGIDGVGRM